MKNYNLKHYAHIGDAVFEVFIRLYVIEKTNVQKTMHHLTVKYVNANFQASLIPLIEPILSEDEKELLKRSRNLPLTSNKKNNQNIHRLATSFEVLVGYLYINDKDKLTKLFEFIKENAL